jgi:hypothetical protein
MKSRIYESERVANKDRRFGSGMFYYPVEIVNCKGEISKGFVTASVLRDATERGNANPEDFPLTWWERVKRWFR